MARDRSFIIPDANAWCRDMPASSAVRCGDLLFIAGQVSADAKLRPLARGDIRRQARNAFARIAEILAAEGGSMDDVLDVMAFVKDPRDMDAVLAVGSEHFPDDGPAWTLAGMTGSYRPELLVSIRAIAHLGPGRRSCVTPPRMAWMRGLPMSAAASKGGHVFTSGLVAADSRGLPVSPGDHFAQARYVYDRLNEVLAASGSGLHDVIDMIAFNHDARGMDAAVGTWCDETIADTAVAEAPTYTAIGMTGLWRSGMVGAFRAIGDLSAGPRVAHNLPSVHWHAERNAGATRKAGGRLVGIAGQVASDGQRNIVGRGDPASQARYCFSQIQGVLEKHGAGLEHLVEITSFHKDVRDWEAVMAAAAEIFPAGAGPAWTPVGCTGLYLEGYQHEIYALAMLPG